VGVDEKMSAIPIGKAELRREGKRIAFLAFGPMLEYCLEAAQTLDSTVVNMRFVKPLDEAMVMRMAAEHELLVTVDENAIAGGAGSAVNECLAAHNVQVSVLNLGLPDCFIQHGGRGDMLHEAGLDSDGILRAIEVFRSKREKIAAQA
jgi:1-deoxy-D-xylulose-5-phosphate synthase